MSGRMFFLHWNRARSTCVLSSQCAWATLRTPIHSTVWMGSIMVLVSVMAWHWTSGKPLPEPMITMINVPYNITGFQWVNTLRQRRNGCRFADNTFKCIIVNEIVIILIKILPKFVPKGPINNIPALLQIMAWHRPSDKPLSEPMMVSLLMHICVTLPQWVNNRFTAAVLTVGVDAYMLNMTTGSRYHFHSICSNEHTSLRWRAPANNKLSLFCGMVCGSLY